MQLSIIIVNYKTGIVLKECIESIFKFENTSNYEIVIVDNFSQDESKSIIEELCSQNKNVSSIILDKKISFSGANNTGIKASSSDYILIMNPDIIFTEPVFKKLIHHFVAVENLGAISPSLIGTDGKFQFDYFQRYPSVFQYLVYQTFFSKLFLKFPRIVNKYISNHNIKPETGKLFITEQLPCAFFMTRKDILEEIGMMDEDFELFYEDVDLSMRINKKYKLAVDTSVSAVHIGGSSLRTADNWWLYGKVILSMNIFFDKHYNSFKSFSLKFISVTNSIITVGYESIKRIIRIEDTYRLKKHKYYLKLFKEKYL